MKLIEVNQTGKSSRFPDQGMDDMTVVYAPRTLITILIANSFHCVNESTVAEEKLDAIIEEVYVELIFFEPGWYRIHDAVDVDRTVRGNGYRARFSGNGKVFR